MMKIVIIIIKKKNDSQVAQRKKPIVNKETFPIKNPGKTSGLSELEASISKSGGEGQG